MDNTYIIRDSLNAFIATAENYKHLKGNFVVMKTKLPHPQFPAYKEYKIRVYYVEGRKEIPIITSVELNNVSSYKDSESLDFRIYNMVISNVLQLCYKLINENKLISLIENESR